MDVAVSNEFKWYESTFIFASRFFFARERERESGGKFSRVVSHARETGWRKIRYRRILFLRRFLRHFWYTGNKENLHFGRIFFLPVWFDEETIFFIFFFFQNESRIKWNSRSGLNHVSLRFNFSEWLHHSEEEVFRATNRVENCGNSGGIYCQEDDIW